MKDNLKIKSGFFYPFYLISLLFSFLFFTENINASDISVGIGTGSAAGVYYPTGVAIAEIINKKKRSLGFGARAEATGGSVLNLNAILAGDLEFGIVQSDRQYQAWNGLKDWKERGPRKKLRSICSFFPEGVVILAGVDSGIENIYDLKGRHINIGNFGSGPRGNAIDALQACKIDWRVELNARGIRAGDSSKLLQQGIIDAFFYTIGHPSSLIKDATLGKRKVRFIPIPGSCIDELVEKWPYYARTDIPVKFYPMAENSRNIETFGVKATFCTNENLPVKKVYLVLREIFNNLDYLKKTYPAFEAMEKDKMGEALTAPLHEGALKFYKEVGLIN